MSHTTHYKLKRLHDKLDSTPVNNGGWLFLGASKCYFTSSHEFQKTLLEHFITFMEYIAQENAYILISARVYICVYTRLALCNKPVQQRIYNHEIDLWTNHQCIESIEVTSKLEIVVMFHQTLGDYATNLWKLNHLKSRSLRITRSGQITTIARMFMITA